MAHRVLVTSPEGQLVAGSEMVPAVFSRSLPFQRSILVVKSNPSSGLQQPQCCMQEGEREKEGEGQRKAAGAGMLGKGLILHPGASAREIVAPTFVPLLPQHLCSEHPS